MSKEIFLIEREKEKLLKKQNDYINSAIENSDELLEKIVKKRLLSKSIRAQKSHKRYLDQITNVEKEIKNKIINDESSSDRRKLTNWKKIQTLRDKAYTLRTYWKPQIDDSNKFIDECNIVEEIKNPKDKKTKKYYEKIFSEDKISARILNGPGISFIKMIVKVLNCIQKVRPILMVLSGILLAINNYLFIRTNNIGGFLLFVICALITFLVLAFVGYIMEKIEYLQEHPLLTVLYIIYLGYIFYGVWGVYEKMGYTDITKTVFIMLIPLLVGVVFLPITIVKAICNRIINGHYQRYAQYYDFLGMSHKKRELADYRILEQKIEKIKNNYRLDNSEILIPEQIYLSILKEYESWAKHHTLISQQDLLTKPNLSYSLIASTKEKLMPHCNNCGYPYYINRGTHWEMRWHRAERQTINHYSGGYFENEETEYDIEIDGQRVGTATKTESYYVPETLDSVEVYYYVPGTKITEYKCPFCGVAWAKTSNCRKRVSESEYNLHKR